MLIGPDTISLKLAVPAGHAARVPLVTLLTKWNPFADNPAISIDQKGNSMEDQYQADTTLPVGAQLVTVAV